MENPASSSKTYQPCRFSSRHTVATDSAQAQTTADRRLDPGQSPPFILEAVCRQALAELLLKYGELGIGDGRGVGRAAERSASVPPSRQARRQRSTDRTLTRRSFAITAVYRPPRTCRRPEAGSPRETPDAQRSGPHPPDNAYHRHTAGIMDRHHPTTTRKSQ